MGFLQRVVLWGSNSPPSSSALPMHPVTARGGWKPLCQHCISGPAYPPRSSITPTQIRAPFHTPVSEHPQRAGSPQDQQQQPVLLCYPWGAKTRLGCNISIFSPRRCHRGMAQEQQIARTQGNIAGTAASLAKPGQTQLLLHKSTLGKEPKSLRMAF